MAEQATNQPSSRSAAPSTLDDIPWEKLNPRAREILRFIAVPISCGYSPSEVAVAITSSDTVMAHLRATTSTMTSHRVNCLMRELRVEIVRISP